MEGRGADEFEPVVVEPSKRLFLIWAVLAVGLAGYGAYAWYADLYMGMFRPEVLVFLALTLLVIMALQWGRRIVATRDVVMEYRYGSEVARAPGRSIRALGISWMGRSLVFDNGGPHLVQRGVGQRRVVAGVVRRDGRRARRSDFAPR